MGFPSPSSSIKLCVARVYSGDRPRDVSSEPPYSLASSIPHVAAEPSKLFPRQFSYSFLREVFRGFLPGAFTLAL